MFSEYPFAHHYFLRDASSSSLYDRFRDSAGSWIKAKGKQDNLWRSDEICLLDPI